MIKQFEAMILKSTGATSLRELETIQSLWSGYGRIFRMETDSSEYPTVVVKNIRFPTKADHPRGWNSDRSHMRKVRSYEIEIAFYNNFNSRLDKKSCYTPTCLGVDTHGDEILIVLEDLNQAGFSKRKRSAGWNEMQPCLRWLADFHAEYLGERPKGLWKTGTYWHLKTRPDELKIMDDKDLKNAASKIDEVLRQSPYQTFVHGDAKLANFCFPHKGGRVAAVDFQYVGGGVGVKDVAYFTGSCLHEEECGRQENKILDFYFGELKKALSERDKKIDFNGLEENWRSLYRIAWADFHRFLKGWSPGSWSKNCYSERVSREVIGQL